MSPSKCAETQGKSWATCELGITACQCGFDSIDRVVHVLKHHNKWRRGADIDAIEPKVIGMAIDSAIELLETKNVV